VFREGIFEGGGEVRYKDHVRFLHGEKAVARTVETDSLGESSFVEALDGERKLVSSPCPVDDLEIDDFHAFRFAVPEKVVAV
jgi:hypothetical protein